MDYYIELIERLRNKTSRDNRMLYREAADAIDELLEQIMTLKSKASVSENRKSKALGGDR